MPKTTKLNKVASLPWGQVYQMGPNSYLMSMRMDGQRTQKRSPDLLDALEAMIKAERERRIAAKIRSLKAETMQKLAQLAAQLPAAEQLSVSDALVEELRPYATGAAVTPAFLRKPPAPLAPRAPAPQAPQAPAEPDRPVRDALRLYLDAIREYVGKSTLDNYRQLLSKLPDVGLHGLTAATARTWLSKNWEGKPTSQQHAMRALSAFWNWCVEQGWVTAAESPMPGLASIRRGIQRQKNRQPKRISVWTPEASEQVYRKAVEIDPRIRGWYLCCAWLGLRPQEAMRITRDDLHDDCLVIPPEKAKSSQGRFRTIEFRGPLEAVGKALQGVSWFDGRLVPWTDPKAPTRIVTEAAAACGAERGHDVLRHTCASYLSVLVGEQECSRLLGHSVEIERGHYNARRTRAEAERFYGIGL